MALWPWVCVHPLLLPAAYAYGALWLLQQQAGRR